MSEIIGKLDLTNEIVNDVKKECFICCEEKSINKFFKCDNKDCNFCGCIDCNKKLI